MHPTKHTHIIFYACGHRIALSRRALAPFRGLRSTCVSIALSHKRKRALRNYYNARLIFAEHYARLLLPNAQHSRYTASAKAYQAALRTGSRLYAIDHPAP